MGVHDFFILEIDVLFFYFTLLSVLLFYT